MKKQMILAFAALLIFGLGIVTFAYKQSTSASTAMSCCCCHGDSCPLKSKSADGKETASCCDNCDCCDGDSCPMMKKDADGKPMKMDIASCPMMKKDEASATAVKTDGEVSCPMMKKDAEGKDMKMDNSGSMSGMQMKHDMKNMKMHGKNCDCSCCHKAKDAEKIDAPAI